MARLFAQPFYTAIDLNGDPISAARLFFYLTGTSTKHAIYTDNALTVAHANPVVADSAGRFAPIYLQDADYKVILAPAGVDDPPGSPIDTIDPVHGAEADDPADLGAPNVFTDTVTWRYGADVASAATLTLTAGNNFDITGTVAITSIATKGVGTIVVLQFAAALTLTHHATDLVLPGGTDIVTSAGDVAILKEYAAGDWRLINYIFGAQSIGLAPLNDPPGELSNGTDAAHEIDIVAGTWRAEDATKNIVLAATTIDIELAGNGGRLDSETLDASTEYHVLSGRNTSDGTFVAGFKKTIAKPAAWDYFRRHLSIYTDGSSNIIAFQQNGDDVLWDVPVSDYSTTNPGTAAVLRTLTVATGVKVKPKHSTYFTHSGLSTAVRLLVTSPEQANTSPTAGLFTVQSLTDATSARLASIVFEHIWTDTSGQIRTRYSSSSAALSIEGTTHGWVDPRGRY